MTAAERKYLAFDLEIATDIPEGTDDWHPLAPLGITVAVTSCRDATVTFYNGDTSADRMTKEQCGQLVRYLQHMVLSGYTIASWNGLGFDFDVLACESGMPDECVELALHHVDMMFHFFCLRGFPIALDKAAQGMNTARKTEGMHGDLAPQMWRDGKREEVIAYTKQDVKATLALAEACEREGRVKWVTKTGALRFQLIDGGWKTVSEALLLPVPDQSWMDAPWPREKFTGWMAGAWGPGHD